MTLFAFFLVAVLLSAWRAHRLGPAAGGSDRLAGRWAGFRLGRYSDGPGTF